MSNVDSKGAILRNSQTLLELVLGDGERTRNNRLLDLAGDQNDLGNAHGVEFKGAVVEIQLEAGNDVEIRILFGVGVVLFADGVFCEGVLVGGDNLVKGLNFQTGKTLTVDGLELSDGLFNSVEIGDAEVEDVTGGLVGFLGGVSYTDKNSTAGGIDSGDFSTETDKELVGGIGGVHYEEEGDRVFLKDKIYFNFFREKLCVDLFMFPDCIAQRLPRVIPGMYKGFNLFHE